MSQSIDITSHPDYIGTVQKSTAIMSYLDDLSKVPELFNHETAVLVMTYQKDGQDVFLNIDADDQYSDLQVSVLTGIAVRYVEQGLLTQTNNKTAMLLVHTDYYKLLISHRVKDVYRISIAFPHNCVLCDDPIDGYGNNAAPLKDGDCCDDCNQTKVLPARFIASKQK